MNQDLKKDLSITLHNEFDKRKQPGEEPVISLPGSMGEALIVTDRRVLVIRESPSARTCSAYSYLLSSVTGAEAEAAGLGGSIRIQAAQVAPPDPNEEQSSSEEDRARVYFPSYDLDSFKAAADEIKKMAADSSARLTPAVPGVQATPGGVVCPACGAHEGPDSLFCRACGQELGAVCAYCGSAVPAGAQFCRVCGQKVLEAPTRCPSCNAHIMRWYTYCAECGSVLHQVCLACGAAVLPSYKHCPSCGRELGSDRLDPATARAAQARLRRLQEEHERKEAEPVESSLVVTSSPRPQGTSTPAAAPSSAEAHNQRGQEAFDQGNMDVAIVEFRQAVSLEPNNATYHCNLAIAYDENEQDDLARAEYEKTLQIDPNDVNALLSLGYMYSENDEPERARDAWTRVVEVAPLSAEAQEAQESLRHQGEL